MSEGKKAGRPLRPDAYRNDPGATLLRLLFHRGKVGEWIVGRRALAAILRVSRDTVDRMLVRGALPAPVERPKCQAWIFDAAHLSRWLRRRSWSH